MGFIREFSYPDILQRRFIYYNSFITFFLLGFIFSEIIILFKYYCIFQPVFKIISIIAVFSIFFGNLLGKLLFKKFSQFRRIYIILDVLFITFSISYIIRKILSPSALEPFLQLFILYPYIIPIILIILPLLAGIKVNYFLKVSCGEFIDDKKGTIPFLSFIITGLISGITVYPLIHYHEPLYYFTVLIPIMILPSLFLIKLPYNTTPTYVRESKEDREESTEYSNKNKKDNLLFTFLNFTYIIIYLFLGHESIIKFYGDIIYIKGFFIVISLLSISLAITIAKTSRSAFWFIYTEMLFPVFFLLFLFLLNKYGERVPFFIGILYFIPASLVFGFSLYHTIEHIMNNYDHNKGYNIINISIFILPAPILLAISFLDSTYLWYFILLYILALLNIIFPGIHLFQSSVGGYKKALYFIFSLIFIPILILIHLYFKIPLNSDLYIKNTRGFEEIGNINYNADFIKKKADVYLHDREVFTASDSIIRNMKRSLMPVYLFKHNLPGDILFFDGNQKFFNNSVIGHFPNTTCIDYIPYRTVDFQKRPFTGSQRYVTEKSDLLLFLQRSDKKFSMIVDIPNLYDQRLNPFRFSADYFVIIKRALMEGGIYAQVIDISNCREEFVFTTVKNYKVNFKRALGFLFANYLVIMGSDDDRSFNLTNEILSKVRLLFEEKHELNYLFYSNLHFLSHMLFNDIDDIITHLNVDIDPFYYFKPAKRTISLNSLVDRFVSNHTIFLKLINEDKYPSYMKRRIEYGLIRNNSILTLLKMTELAETGNEYEIETENLFKLKRYSEYNSDLRGYIYRILSFKEEYYLDTALRLEKEKKWEEAKRLYQAILIINRNNFEANYRLGILSITLQDLNESFKYLQYAMKLKSDEPRVLYQMGVLLFSSGKPSEALNYLHRALNMRESPATLYLYLGLCNEELDRLNEAKGYYQKALLKDPNDNNIISSVERIKNKIEEEKKRWDLPERRNQTDVEQGEKIPLPIIKSALKKRLTDKEAKSLKKPEENR